METWGGGGAALEVLRGFGAGIGCRGGMGGVGGYSEGLLGG